MEEFHRRNVHAGRDLWTVLIYDTTLLFVVGYVSFAVVSYSLSLVSSFVDTLHIYTTLLAYVSDSLNARFLFLFYHRSDDNSILMHTLSLPHAIFILD